MRRHSNHYTCAAVAATKHSRAKRDSLPNPVGWRSALAGSVLAVAAMCIGTAAHAAAGDQIIVRTLIPPGAGPPSSR